MIFKKLEIIGFKSFYTKTTLNFEPGITAIVGPNGCGKSNIFDSIRWVLGEQSVKVLRGSQMEDVIFSGTEAKEQLGMAEVSLTFDNELRHFPMDHREVEITRRIFRSGESEYLLNKTLVRLKDITDLLAGTGIGAESYSLIQQGKIDLVLSSKPEDRRLVFDEASGISKYKAQKRETMRRLEETEQNLLRVNDIVAEVKRQISSLERQANKARRYKEVFEELKLKETQRAVFQKKVLLGEKAEILKKLHKLEIQKDALAATIREEESKILNRQLELKTFQDAILNTKNEMLGLENLVSRNQERIHFNKERAAELDAQGIQLETQIEQTKNRLILDEEKLNKVREEYNTIEKNIADKTSLLQEKESELNRINQAIKHSLDEITKAKHAILDIAARISAAKNEITEATSQQQIYFSRKKRLEIEKAKLYEERAGIEMNLNSMAKELATLEKIFAELALKVSEINTEEENQRLSLTQLNTHIGELEKKRISLESHRQFLEQLRTKYEDMGEAMNAVIYLDKIPSDKINGLVIKVTGYPTEHSQEDSQTQKSKIKLSGEAKPIDLDTGKISEAIHQLTQEIASLKNAVSEKESYLENLKKTLAEKQNDLREQEIVLANKKTQLEGVREQCEKISDEEEVVSLELTDVQKELALLEEKLQKKQAQLTQLNDEQKHLEDTTSSEQNAITSHNELKEDVLVLITRTKTELDALHKRIHSDQATLKILEGTYLQDKETLLGLQSQGQDAETKKESLMQEAKELEREMNEAQQRIRNHTAYLTETQEKYDSLSGGTNEVTQKIEFQRRELDTLKNRMYELEMHSKDLDFKYLSIKERILQGYKIELDSLADTAEEIQEAPLIDEIQELKEKIDSYGTVNLVAIEEYDELKKRYDFLTQQQNDLNTAKESLHEAIQKINRTTKKLFLETFEKIGIEFRNYFRLLFNGGDCQIFLIDEQDPLESGIEIICRPPGKKLQNILLLSGGEKSLAAIALIFAIFKVKPAPFCVLDEIDAALDEANVDRFGRLLQEFTKSSQFIVITHNKKTIANADVMYGITMEESGISKIVSVRFAQNKADNQKEPEEQKIEEAVG